MKSTQIHSDTIGGKIVSTVFIEDETYRYYETAFATVEKRGRARWISDYEVHESGVKTREEADQIHAAAIEIAEKVLAYNER